MLSKINLRFLESNWKRGSVVFGSVFNKPRVYLHTPLIEIGFYLDVCVGRFKICFQNTMKRVGFKLHNSISRTE